MKFSSINVIFSKISYKQLHFIHLLYEFLPPATKLGQGNIFRSVCQQFCRGGRAWFYLGGRAWFYSGGMRGFIRGACMVLFGGACVVLFGGACVVLFGGACVVLFGGVGGRAWFYSGGGACVVLFGGACVVAPGGGVRGCSGGRAWFFDEIRSMSGRYASYWNAFLFGEFSSLPFGRMICYTDHTGVAFPRYEFFEFLRIPFD